MRNIDRNNKIISLFVSGIPGTEIGRKFGISRERVRQILDRNGVSRFSGGVSLSAKINAEKRKQEYLNQWMPLPKCTKRFFKETPTYIKRKYLWQRESSKRRGIPFIISLPEWIKVWEDSGHFHEYGKKVGQYCMGRIGDKGNYEVGNVHIITCSQNHSDAWKYKRWSPWKNRQHLKKH